MPIELPTAKYPKHGRVSTAGCVSAIPLILFFLIAVFTLAYLFYDHRLRSNAMRQLSPADQQKVQLWMSKPLNLDNITMPARPSPATEQQRTEYFQLSDELYDKTLPVFRANPDFYRKYVAGEYLSPSENAKALNRSSIPTSLWKGIPLSTTETALLAEMTSLTEELVAQAIRLTANTEYSLSRYDYDAGVDVHHSDDLLSCYAMAKARFSDYPAALEGFGALVELMRVPQQVALRSAYASKIELTAKALAAQTSETAILSQLLQSMNRAREVSLHAATAQTLLRPSGIRKLKEMRELGFIEQLPTNLGDALLLVSFGESLVYHQYVVDTLPPSDPRHIQSKARVLVSSVRPSSQDKLLAKADVGLLSPAVHRLQMSIQFSKNVRHFEDDFDRATDTNRAITQFDLARLELARRIAKLNSKPTPRTPADFVPDYLPAFPSDSFTSGPLSYNPDHGYFYSVGPDGQHATGDEIQGTWQKKN